MTDTTSDVIERAIGPARWAQARIERLSAAERRLYRSVLDAFVAGLPRPDGAEMAGLVERDLVVLGADGDVTAAYPFSARPTRHRLRLVDGRSYWAMCAIDALGIPYMLDSDEGPHLDAGILTVPEATHAGRRLFGDLLRHLGS